MEFETLQVLTKSHCHRLAGFSANYIDHITCDTSQTKGQISNTGLKAIQGPKAFQQH